MIKSSVLIVVFYVQALTLDSRVSSSVSYRLSMLGRTPALRQRCTGKQAATAALLLSSGDLRRLPFFLGGSSPFFGNNLIEKEDDETKVGAVFEYSLVSLLVALNFSYFF